MTTIFLDTGYVLALELANDQYHDAVREHWIEASSRRLSFVTTTYVFDEIVTFFNCRGYHEKAVEVGNNLLQSTAIKLNHVDDELFEAGWQLLEQYQDKQFSLTDCISFVVMNRQGIRTAFTVDHHFEQAGFQTEPEFKK